MPALDTSADDDDAHALAALDQEIAETRERIQNRSRDIADANTRSQRLAEAHTAALAEQRATPEGLSTSMRTLELALLHRRPPAELRKLQRLHVQAEIDAAAEYRARVARWGHSPGDGPLQACPLGGCESFVSWALHLNILGTYRYSIDHPSDSVAVRLTRPGDGSRNLRTKINARTALIDAEGLTLAVVFTAAFANPIEDAKLRRWLDEHYNPIKRSLSA